MHRFVLIFEADRCSDRTQTSQYLKKRGNIVFVTLRVGRWSGQTKRRNEESVCGTKGWLCVEERGGFVQKEKKMGRGRCKGRLVTRQVATIKPSD